MSHNFTDVKRLIREAERVANSKAAASGHLTPVKLGRGKSYINNVKKYMDLGGEIDIDTLQELGKTSAKKVFNAEARLNDRIEEYDTYYDIVTDDIAEELKTADVQTVALRHGWAKFTPVVLPTYISWNALPSDVRKDTWNNSTDTQKAFNYDNQYCGFWDKINPQKLFNEGTADDFGNTVENWFDIVYKNSYYMERDAGFIVFNSEWNSASDISARYTEDYMYKR